MKFVLFREDGDEGRGCVRGSGVRYGGGGWYDIEQWDKDLQDFYVSVTGPLPVRFTERR